MELTGQLWDFEVLDGEQAGMKMPVLTPSCWETYPGLGLYRGRGRYTTSFEAEGTIRLEFKGVSHTATVLLDGRQIATHYNAYTIFDVIVPDLEPGEHKLEIIADNRFSEDSALHIPNDYMSYGGITRPVVLEELEQCYIRQLHVTTTKAGDRWLAQAEALVANVGDEPAVRELNLELDGTIYAIENVEVPAGEEISLTVDIELEGVSPWSPENPELYEIRAVLLFDGEEEDDLIERFGFREIKVSGKQLLMNGEPIKIRGFCRHEDHPQFGCALPPSAMYADLQLIMDMGGNSVRTSHYPNDEIFLDICDELGILVWEENHARGLSEQDMRNPNFEAQAEQCIREMIPAHYNHPCIYIWGILNECASETEYGRSCYKAQFDLIRELDASRPVSFASCKFKTDKCFDLPDVVSYNIYPMWYHETPADEYYDDLYSWVQEETGGAGKPYMITEVGAGGIYGYRKSYDSKWTEENQAKTIEKQLEAILSHEDLVGVYIWQFCDCRVSEEWFSGRPRTMNNKGIVDEYRRPKLAYDIVKRIYSRF